MFRAAAAPLAMASALLLHGCGITKLGEYECEAPHVAVQADGGGGGHDNCILSVNCDSSDKVYIFARGCKTTPELKDGDAAASCSKYKDEKAQDDAKIKTYLCCVAQEDPHVAAAGGVSVNADTCTAPWMAQLAAASPEETPRKFLDEGEMEDREAFLA